MSTSSAGLKISFLRSVRGQIFVLFLALSLIPLVVAGGIIFFQSQRIIRTETEKEFTTMGDLQAKEITNWIAERKKDTLTLAGIARILTMEADSACPAVDQYFKQWSIYQDIFVLRPDGSRLCDTLGETSNVSERPFFKQALHGSFSVSDPLFEEITAAPVLITAAPLRKDNKVIGVVALTISTNYLSSLLKTVQAGQTREAYLVGEDGLFITDSRFNDSLLEAGRVKKNAILELKIDSIGIEHALQNEAGLDEYPGYYGKTVLGVYRPIPTLGSGAALLLEQDLDEVQLAAKALRNSILWIALFSGMAVIGLAILFGRLLTNPLTFISEKLNQLAIGNLEQESSQSLKLRQRRDEYGVMSQALENVTHYFSFVSATASQIAQGDLTMAVTARSENDTIGAALHQMIRGLQDLIGAVKENAGQLHVSAAHLEETSKQAGQATNQITTTIQQVALGINQQAESVSKTSASTNQMNQSIRDVTKGTQEQAGAVGKASEITAQITKSIYQVAANAETGARGASQAGEIAREGAQTVEETIKSMQSIKASVGQSAEKVREMGVHSDQIGVIIETIDDIASQTNMLALNAAIEAARAGEQGKGFAVVADEVRKLAERSSNATKEIGSLIRGIQNSVAAAVSAMDTGAVEVEHGVLCANQSGDALNSILRAVESVNGQVGEIASVSQTIHTASDELVRAMNIVSAVVQENITATEAMLKSSSVVSESIESFASVSEENSASVEEVSASTEEMNAQIEDMGASVQSLAHMAQTLQQAVTQFKTEK